MSLTKKDILRNITKDTNLSSNDSLKILESFLRTIKVNSKSKCVKISSFGSFVKKLTSERIGRNPKTKESFKIKASKKIVFKASTKLKKIIN